MMRPQELFHFIIVEDSKLDAFIAEKILENFRSVYLSLEVFLDPQEALKAILSKEVSKNRTIVFLDIQMPLMNGFEFIESFEKQASPEMYSGFVINMLSSSIDARDVIKAKSYRSVNVFLNKPLRRELVQNMLDDLESKNNETS
ncbi:MAG TPA: response regulator [Sphingobacteriaceae bacterium]|nr:response regulator [Sphingobacteriaceae bacterium]